MLRPLQIRSDRSPRQRSIFVAPASSPALLNLWLINVAGSLDPKVLTCDADVGGYAEGRTTVIDLSIRTHLAGLFSCGATRRNGPSIVPSGAPSIVSATITSES